MSATYGTLQIALLALALQGCAAIPLAVFAGSLVDAGGGVLVKTGTEYSASGTARRTFNLSSDDVHTAVLETFQHAEITVTRDEPRKNGRTILGATQGRKIRVRLFTLTPVLTAMELDVKRNLLASDKATASELLAENEHVLAERSTVALRVEAPAVDPVVRTPKRRR